MLQRYIKPFHSRDLYLNSWKLWKKLSLERCCESQLMEKIDQKANK